MILFYITLHCNRISNHYKYSTDTSSEIAFCCDYYNLDYHACCYSDEVWSLWCKLL